MRGSSPLGVAVAGADTNAHAFADDAAAGVYIWVPSGNTGTVTVSDAAGITANSLVGGIVIPKGLAPFFLGPLLNMGSLAYQFSNAADSFSYLVVR